MVTNCCRFLCYFCRISRQNQRSMFDHLSYLLQNSGIGLGQYPQSEPPCFFFFSCWNPVAKVNVNLNVVVIVAPPPGMRGSTPLDVAAASCIDNNELALALQEQDLEKVRVLSSRLVVDMNTRERKRCYEAPSEAQS